MHSSDRDRTEGCSVHRFGSIFSPSVLPFSNPDAVQRSGICCSVFHDQRWTKRKCMGMDWNVVVQ